MIHKTKYVVGLARAGHVEQVVAIVFPEDMNHVDLGLAVFGSKNRIIGAGFCDVTEREGHATTMSVYGDSVSLRIKSRPEDVHYLNQTMGLSDDSVDSAIQRKDRETILEQIRAANAQIGVTQLNHTEFPKAANE
jgi:hypothetical protein